MLEHYHLDLLLYLIEAGTSDSEKEVPQLPLVLETTEIIKEVRRMYFQRYKF